MDIQDLVERRIAELQGQTVTFQDDDIVEQDSMRHGRCDTQDGEDKDIRDRRPIRERRRSSDRIIADSNVNHFCEIVDAALVEVAGRVMEIADRITEDHTRLEKELLSLRLETLESAESVMDMALSIRKKARQLVADTSRDNVQATDANRRGFDVDCEEIDSKLTAVPDGRPEVTSVRASMHDVGVAALFRKTH